VLFAARSESRAAAEAAIERMRFATGVDDDLRPFYERFAGDAVIGKAVRAFPHLRIHRRPAPWEALAWAITEQLIELERALVIQRRLVFRLGRRCPHSGLRDRHEDGLLAHVQQPHQRRAAAAQDAVARAAADPERPRRRHLDPQVDRRVPPG